MVEEDAETVSLDADTGIVSVERSFEAGEDWEPVIEETGLSILVGVLSKWLSSMLHRPDGGTESRGTKHPTESVALNKRRTATFRSLPELARTCRNNNGFVLFRPTRLFFESSITNELTLQACLRVKHSSFREPPDVDCGPSTGAKSR